MGASAPVARAAHWALAVLTAINLLNYLDRYVVPPIVPQLESAMALSDQQIGWLVPAFMLVYMVAAPFFGAWGDRGSRIQPIALGVLIWSVATVLSGLARNYPQLLAARALVGVGEAAYVAIAPALLVDFFPAHGRARVLAVFNMAVPVGAALGYVLGGLLGQHFGWRSVFLVAGAPGVLLALTVLRLPDPPRGAHEQGSAPQPLHSETRSPVAIYLGLLRRGPYMLVVLGFAAYTFGLGGLSLWMPTFLERVRGVSAVEATTGLGAILVVTGFVGTFAGGWLGDYLLRYSRRAHLWLIGASTLLGAPVALLALTAPSAAVYYPALVIAELLLFISTGPANAAIAHLVPPLQRASAFALCVFAIHLFGDVPSPVLIGYLSDHGSLAHAVLIVPAAIAVSGAVWLIAARVVGHPHHAVHVMAG